VLFTVQSHSRPAALAFGTRFFCTAAAAVFNQGFGSYLFPPRAAPLLLWRQAGAPTSQPASSGFRALVFHTRQWRPQQQLATR
jgi:hypothetical protein